MESKPPNPLRIEFTILDEKLFREHLTVREEPIPHIFYCSRYADAVAPPFPSDGKQGVSIFVGRLEQYKQSQASLLWELERKRGRHRIAVVTNLRGKEFAPALRDVQGHLSDNLLVPLSFLRRRGNKWDSLDFFSSGESESMKGAAPRLKRLKQRGWETMIDRLTLTDPEVKSLYFKELHLERDRLQEFFLTGFAEKRISPMIGIAGQCLQKDHLGLLLQESMLERILRTAHQTSSYTKMAAGWTFLGKRVAESELLLLTEGDNILKETEVLVGEADGALERRSEFLVSNVLQKKKLSCRGASFSLIRAKVDWRYPPAREIPVRWRQKSTSPAGSEVLHG